MRNTEEQVNHHVQVKTKSSRGHIYKMACEKASRRLKTTLLKASRLGVTTVEVTRLPSAKKLISRKDHSWRLAVLVILMFVGGIVAALICTARSGCSRIEEIVSKEFK